MRSGYMIKILREEKWQRLDITELSDYELDKFFEVQPKETHKKWAKMMIAVIKNGKPAGKKT